MGQIRYIGEPLLTSGCAGVGVYDKMVEISGIGAGRDALRPYDKLLKIRGIVVEDSD